VSEENYSFCISDSYKFFAKKVLGKFAQVKKAPYVCSVIQKQQVMQLSKANINNKTSVKHAKSFGAHAEREYYVEISSPNGLLAFEGRTNHPIRVWGSPVRGIVHLNNPDIVRKEDFVKEVQEYLRDNH